MSSKAGLRYGRGQGGEGSISLKSECLMGMLSTAIPVCKAASLGSILWSAGFVILRQAAWLAD